MLQYNGKIIGSANEPDSTAINSSANGIWSIKAIEFHKRNNRWPLQPGLPSSPSVSINSIGNNQLLVDIQPPNSNGGIPITGYALDYSINSSPYNWINYINTNTIMNIAVTGLVNDTAYVLRSLAYNSFGAGSYSQISNPGTPVAILPPGVPTNVAASAGDTSAFLTWTAPSDIGGAPITDYAIQYSSNSGLSWTTFIKNTSIDTNSTVTGLTNGLSYIFRVATINLGGISSFSSTSNIVIPDTTPVINIVTQPLNDRVLSSIEVGTFVTSGIVSNGSSPTYQWQVWAQEYYGNGVWYNMLNQNSPILQITKDSLSSSSLNETYEGSGYMFRSILSYPGAVSITGRHAHIHEAVSYSTYTGLFYDANGNDYISPNGTNTVNGNPYLSFQLDSNIYIYIYNEIYDINYYNWHNQPTLSAYLQKSINATDWTNVSSIMGFYGQSLQILAEPEVGTIYYRIIMQDLWPYTVVDGSVSRSENPHINIPYRYQITWISPP